MREQVPKQRDPLVQLPHQHHKRAQSSVGQNAGRLLLAPLGIETGNDGEGLVDRERAAPRTWRRLRRLAVGDRRSEKRGPVLDQVFADPLLKVLERNHLVCFLGVLDELLPSQQRLDDALDRGEPLGVELRLQGVEKVFIGQDRQPVEEQQLEKRDEGLLMTPR